MVAGGGEVMGEGVTAELVAGRTEKKLLMLMLRIARDWWSSGNFFRGSCPEILPVSPLTILV